jgi:hypothetical protein
MAPERVAISKENKGKKLYLIATASQISMFRVNYISSILISAGPMRSECNTSG